MHKKNLTVLKLNIFVHSYLDRLTLSFHTSMHLNLIDLYELSFRLEKPLKHFCLLNWEEWDQKVEKLW